MENNRTVTLKLILNKDDSNKQNTLFIYTRNIPIIHLANTKYRYRGHLNHLSMQQIYCYLACFNILQASTH